MEYHKLFISGRVLSADEIKAMKKEIRPTDKIGQLILSMLLFDYMTAAQIIRSSTLCKKHPNIEQYMRGIFEFETLQYESAEILFKSIQQGDELYEASQFKLSEIYFNKALYVQSAEILIVYDSEKFIERLISCYFMLGKFSEALSLCDKIQDVSLSTVITLFLTDGFQELIRYIDTLTEIEGELKHDLCQIKGFCYIKLSMPAEAINVLTKLPQLNNKSQITWTLLGIAYSNASMIQEAFWCFIKSTQISPANIENWLNICFLYSKNSRIQEAELLLLRARKIDPNVTTPENYILPDFDFSTIGCRKSKFVPKPRKPEKDIKDNIFCCPKPKKCAFKQYKKHSEMGQEDDINWSQLYNEPDIIDGATALGNMLEDCDELKFPKKHIRADQFTSKIKKKNRLI